jgi:hypothetical protein
VRSPSGAGIVADHEPVWHRDIRDRATSDVGVASNQREKGNLAGSWHPIGGWGGSGGRVQRDGCQTLVGAKL